jgi:hypothetical protein
MFGRERGKGERGKGKGQFGEKETTHNLISESNFRNF